MISNINTISVVISIGDSVNNEMTWVTGNDGHRIAAECGSTEHFGTSSASGGAFLRSPRRSVAVAGRNGSRADECRDSGHPRRSDCPSAGGEQIPAGRSLRTQAALRQTQQDRHHSHQTLHRRRRSQSPRHHGI